jgi:hypothetical protein
MQVEPVHLPDIEHCSISFPDRDFKVGHYMEAWEMEGEDEDAYALTSGGRSVSGGSGTGSVRSGTRPRSAAIARPHKATGVERRGNTTKIRFLLSLGERAEGRVAVSVPLFRVAYAS